MDAWHKTSGESNSSLVAPDTNAMGVETETVEGWIRLTMEGNSLIDSIKSKKDLFKPLFLLNNPFIQQQSKRKSFFPSKEFPESVYYENIHQQQQVQILNIQQEALEIARGESKRKTPLEFVSPSMKH